MNSVFETRTDCALSPFCSDGNVSIMPRARGRHEGTGPIARFAERRSPALAANAARSAGSTRALRASRLDAFDAAAARGRAEPGWELNRG
jgi:hypothetical protein